MSEQSTESSTPKVDVDAAFKALFSGKPMEPTTEQPAAAPEKPIAAATAEPAVTESAKAEAPAQGQEQATETQEPETEDVASLKARMAQRETEFEEQLTKARQQGSQGIEWSRNLALRKASESAAAKAILKRIKAGEQVPTEEVDRILEGSQEAVMPQAAIPQAPALSNPFAPAQGQEVDEGVLSEVNQFALDHGLDEKGALDLIAWMKDPASPLTQRDVVPGSVYHTLALAKVKYDRVKQDGKKDTAKAMASVAKTQREAAKAAGALGARATPSPPADKPVDWTKLPTEERKKVINVDELFRQVAGS